MPVSIPMQYRRCSRYSGVGNVSIQMLNVPIVTVTAVAAQGQRNRKFGISAYVLSTILERLSIDVFAKTGHGPQVVAWMTRVGRTRLFP